MKQFLIIIVLSISSIAILNAQKKPKPEPVLQPVSNKEVVQSVFPASTKVEKINDYWFKILDDKNKVYGYAMTSTNYCKNIIGYNNTTPVIIITDKKMVIKKIALLSHYESPGYIKRLQQMGFFNNWDNLKLKEAGKVNPDAYTGATVTALAVNENVKFLIENGLKNLPR
jgi:Na+-translocating ferredoxin:NAD+ oxidoreductase RnfG subunit